MAMFHALHGAGRIAGLTLALCLGCPSGEADDDTTAADDDDTPPDLASGAWQQELVAEPGGMPRVELVLPLSGSPALAWEEPGGIVVARRGGDAWEPESVPPPQPDDLCGVPALAAGGAALDLGCSCLQGDGLERVFHRRSEGDGWGAPAEVSAEDPDGSWQKFSPVLTLEPDGQPRMAYAASTSPTPDDVDSRVRLVRFVQGTPTGVPELVIDAPGEACHVDRVVVGEDGLEHLVALCIPPAADPYHILATGDGATWQRTTIPAGALGHVAALALDPDGTTVWVAWEEAVAFEARVLVAPYAAGTLGPGVVAAEGAGLIGLAVDRHGRPLVLAVGNGVLTFAWSDDGGATFAGTPMTFAAGLWPHQGAIAADPETALPRVAFTLIDETYQADLYHATYEPGE